MSVMESRPNPDRRSIEFLCPEAGHVRELARICYEAFGHLHDFHRVPRDFPELPLAERVIGLMVSQPGVFGVAVRCNGRLAGSNFLSQWDEVGGVGPITVDPDMQGWGLGRGLMEHVLAHAAEQGMSQVRLVQESVNTASLSLYSSLGFSVREPLGLMAIAAPSTSDPSVRAATVGDLGLLDQLSRRFYRVSRRNELSLCLGLGSEVLLRERQGTVRGYFLPGKLGHGVAETVEDVLALIGEGGRRVSEDVAVFLCPLRQSDLYRGALHAGHRLLKTFTYMTYGPYPEPQGTWLPSYGY